MKRKFLLQIVKHRFDGTPTFWAFRINGHDAPFPFSSADDGLAIIRFLLYVCGLHQVFELYLVHLLTAMDELVGDEPDVLIHRSEIAAEMEIGVILPEWPIIERNAPSIAGLMANSAPPDCVLNPPPYAQTEVAA